MEDLTTAATTGGAWAGKGPCNATMLAKLQDYRDAFLSKVEASAAAVATLNHGYALTGCMQHEEICRDNVSQSYSQYSVLPHAMLYCGVRYELLRVRGEIMGLIIQRTD
jgi:hypothetical protein